MGLKRVLRRWMLNTDAGADKLASPIKAMNTILTAEDLMESAPETRLTFGKALNGQIITISRFKRNPHGPDWVHQFYVVGEGEGMMEAVKTCMVLTNLEK